MPDPAVLTALKATKDGIEVLDKLGALESVLLKLKSNPDKAVAKLTQALGELQSGYTALHNEMVALGSLSFAPEDLPDTRKRLRELRGGRLKTELAAVKGNCARIDSIYRRYLTGWFNRVLTKAESARIESLFFDLADMDGRFLGSADALSHIAQQHAAEILTLLQGKGVKKATELTHRLDVKLTPMTQQLSSYMSRLWDLQAEFIAISRAL